MTVIAFDSTRRTLTAYAPGACSHAPSRSSRPLQGPENIWLSRANRTLWFAVGDEGDVKKGASEADLLATGLFRRNGRGGLRASDDSVAARLGELARGLRAGRSLSAIFLVPGGATFIADAFLPDDQDIECDTLGYVMLRRLKPAPWRACDLSCAYGLTHREADVVLGMLQGHCVPEVAERLGLRAGTVRQYLKAIYEKTGTSTQAQLMALLNGGVAFATTSENE